MRIRLFVLLSIFSTACSDLIYQNSTNICQRCTCTKSEDARTLHLDCSNQNFSFMLADWPEHSATLKASFSGNDFASLERLPGTDASLEINLSRCKIERLYPGVFEATINVKFVDLSHNSLTSEGISEGGLRGPFSGSRQMALAIEDLDLAYNQIHSLPKKTFECMPNLTRLNLEGNDFVVLDAPTQMALSSIKRLSSLNLANNELTEVVPVAIQNLEDLVELDLSKNSLDFVPYSLEKVGKSLQILILDDNPIIELTSVTFAALQNLTFISLNRLPKLKRIEAGTFSATSKLTKLSICNDNLLEEVDPQAFSPDLPLEELYMSNNSLRTIPYQLLNWTRLDVVDFNTNPLECNCDLYKISSNLSVEVKRNRDGPTCMNSFSGRYEQVYTLERDICSIKTARRKARLKYHHMSLQLAGLLTVLTIGTLVAIFLGYSKYKGYMKYRSDPYVSQVVYSPLFNARN